MIIAQAFYRSGIIEAWGRGILKIKELCKAAGIPQPEFIIENKEVIVRFRHSLKLQPLAESRIESGARSILSLPSQRPLSIGEIVKKLGAPTSTGPLKWQIKELLTKGIIEYTVPEKPNSRLQKYRLKEK